jgi:ribose transport system permease protein
MMASATLASPGRHRLRNLLISKGPLLLFALLLTFFALRAPNFLDWQNLATILKQSVPLAILCCGLATVVIAGGDDVVKGGIDLSIPANSVLVAAIIAQLVVHGGVAVPVALLLAALAGLAVGVVNAALVVAVGMTPLLATLATSVAVVGLTKVVTSSRRINLDGPIVTVLRDGSVLGVPLAVLLMLLVGGGFFYAMHWTRWGLQLQAVGGNRDAADISGLPSNRRTVQAFLVAALAAVIAAPAILARGSGSSPGSDETLLVEMVLATFLGAAFSPRRVVTVWGAILGAVLVNALSNGLALMHVDIFWIGGIKGALILVVVATAAIRSGNQR